MILQCQSELKDVQTDHQRTMESLLESVRELDKELKLQIQMINSYIPNEFQVFNLNNIYCIRHLEMTNEYYFKIFVIRF